jgi:hypothetical protein
MLDPRLRVSAKDAAELLVDAFNRLYNKVEVEAPVGETPVSRGEAPVEEV